MLRFASDSKRVHSVESGSRSAPVAKPNAPRRLLPPRVVAAVVLMEW
jgi:hypothetical protein